MLICYLILTQILVLCDWCYGLSHHGIGVVNHIMERVTLSRKHLLALKASCHFSDQTTNLLRSPWSTSALLMLLTNPYRTLSSANRPNSEVIWRPMSLMYSKNITGPRTVPWGTPEVTVTGEDCEPLTTTFWVLPQSQDSIRLISCPRVP